MHGDKFPCDLCKEKLASNYSLLRHRAAKHGIGKLCEHCQTVLGTLSALNRHIAEAHNIGEQCKHCLAILPPDKLDWHMRSHRAGSAGSGGGGGSGSGSGGGGGGGVYSCECDRPFVSEHEFMAHRRNCSMLARRGNGKVGWTLPPQFPPPPFANKPQKQRQRKS